VKRRFMDPNQQLETPFRAKKSSLVSSSGVIESCVILKQF